MYARDIMSSPVVAVTPETTIADAVKLLAERHIGGMPVVEGDKVVGMFSESDLLHRAETQTERPRRSAWREWLASNRELAANFLHERGTQVRDVMTSPIVSVSEFAHIREIADLLERKAIRRVPVLRDGKLVGIVSRSDLVRALASVVEIETSPSETLADSEVREAIVRAFEGKRWGLTAQNVLVKDGVAHLWGIVRSEEERRAIEMTVEKVAGVKEVDSRLDYPAIFPMP